jgi:transcriptional regulator with XRE-family HTH domain
VPKDYASVFGAALAEQLARHKLTQTDLAKARGVSPAYISRLASKSAPSPEWVDLIADTTKATEEERAKLHTAAARTRGYRIP